jgi:hypothetical protein
MHRRADRSAAYRIEHREGERRTVVALGTQPLAPLADRLAAEGRGGVLELVDAQTGRAVIRCRVGPAAPAPSA